MSHPRAARPKRAHHHHNGRVGPPLPAIGGTEVLDRLDALEDLVKNVLVPSLQRIEQRLGTDPEALDDDPDGIAVDRGDILDDWGGESSGTPWADCFNSMGNGLDEALESLANTQDDA